MIIDQLENINCLKLILEDIDKLNDINKEIACYHCLNTKIT